jgi:hypothetical protein
MMQEKARQFPGVQLILGKSLGFDECLVDLARRRIEESRNLCDVRELRLKSKDCYPLPPGQYEFVLVPPDEVEKYEENDPHHSGS